MKYYIIGNWKCHKSTADGREWFDRFTALYKPHPDVEVVVAPSAIILENIAIYLDSLAVESLTLAAQDISPFPRGSYTGAIAADMIVSMAKYTIVGH